MKQLSLLFIVFSFASLTARNPVVYNHKSLEKGLQKLGFEGMSDFVEFNPCDSALKNTNGKYFVLKPELESAPIKYVYIGRVNSCRAGGCSISGPSENLDSEYFDYFMFFDSAASVSALRVFNYQATHGFEICAKGWLKQFVGYQAEQSLSVGKEVDGISGATISVYAITEDVQLATRTLQKSLCSLADL